MVHKNSPRTAIGTIGEYVENKQAEVAKAEAEKAKAEAAGKEEEKKKDEKKNKDENTKVKNEAIELAVDAIVQIVKDALASPSKKTESSDEAGKIEVEKVDAKSVEEERKADDLVVEVE